MESIINYDINIFDNNTMLNYDTSNWNKMIEQKGNVYFNCTIIQKVLCLIIDKHERKRVNYINIINLTYKQLKVIIDNLKNLNINEDRFKLFYYLNFVSLRIEINDIWNIPNITFLEDTNKKYINFINNDIKLCRLFNNFYKNHLIKYRNECYINIVDKRLRIPLKSYLLFRNLLEVSSRKYQIYLNNM